MRSALRKDFAIPVAAGNLMRDLDELFAALAQSRFRSRFRLGSREAAYLEKKGLDVVMSHAADFLRDRLAPAEPKNDGRQTPMRGHPAFIAQHATGACCRSCVAKWHGIAAGQPLSVGEIEQLLAAIRRWLTSQAARDE
jgi:hypothetical protein